MRPQIAISNLHNNPRAVKIAICQVTNQLIIVQVVTY